MFSWLKKLGNSQEAAQTEVKKSSDDWSRETHDRTYPSPSREMRTEGDDLDYYGGYPQHNRFVRFNTLGDYDFEDNSFRTTDSRTTHRMRTKPSSVTVAKWNPKSNFFQEEFFDDHSQLSPNTTAKHRHSPRRSQPNYHRSHPNHHEFFTPPNHHYRHPHNSSNRSPGSPTTTGGFQEKITPEDLKIYQYSYESGHPVTTTSAETTPRGYVKGGFGDRCVRMPVSEFGCGRGFDEELRSLSPRNGGCTRRVDHVSDIDWRRFERFRRERRKREMISQFGGYGLVPFNGSVEKRKSPVRTVSDQQQHHHHYQREFEQQVSPRRWTATLPGRFDNFAEVSAKLEQDSVDQTEYLDCSEGNLEGKRKFKLREGPKASGDRMEKQGHRILLNRHRVRHSKNTPVMNGLNLRPIKSYRLKPKSLEEPVANIVKEDCQEGETD